MPKRLRPGLVRLCGLALVGLLSVLGVGDSETSSGAPTKKAPTVNREAVIRIHHDAMAFSQADCLQCHGSRYDERAPHNSGILTAHAAMLQFRYPPPGGADLVTADTCRECHKRVDLYEESGATIRKQVSLEEPAFFQATCVQCHADDFQWVERTQAKSIWSQYR